MCIYIYIDTWPRNQRARGPYCQGIMCTRAIGTKDQRANESNLLEASIAIHPTIGEEFVTFGGWGQVKQRDVVKVQLPPYLR